MQTLKTNNRTRGRVFVVKAKVVTPVVLQGTAKNGQVKCDYSVNPENFCAKICVPQCLFSRVLCEITLLNAKLKVRILQLHIAV